MRGEVRREVRREEKRREERVKIMRREGDAKTRTVSSTSTVLRESVRDGTTDNFHLCGDTQTRSSSRLLQEILNILLPSSVAVKVGRSSHSPSLEETGGVALLQSD